MIPGERRPHRTRPLRRQTSARAVCTCAWPRLCGAPRAPVCQKCRPV